MGGKQPWQIEKCLEDSKLTREIKRLKSTVQEQRGAKKIVCNSKKMKKVLQKVARAAETDSVVLVNGESGTGKELVANNLHLAGARKSGPFVALNCAAIPETLLESELFGYVKGAFTGADGKKKGLLVQAQGGTLFLDEIAELTFSMQAKLLRVLEEKTVCPLGSTKPVKFDARIINVRELKNAIESAVVLTDKNLITEDLILPAKKIKNTGIPSLKVAKKDFEKNYLIELIEHTKGNVSQAAKLAGKYRADLYELLKKHQLDPDDFREK